MLDRVNDTTPHQIQLLNENDLHFKVVAFTRRFYPHNLIVTGLGELQDTTKKRSESYYKGYRGGCPDIIILNHHRIYDGFAIEFKSPTGKGRLSDNQDLFLKRMRTNNFKTIVSSDYDEIIMELVEYMRDTRVVCNCCWRHFLNEDTLNNHMKHFHKLL